MLADIAYTLWRIGLVLKVDSNWSEESAFAFPKLNLAINGMKKRKKRKRKRIEENSEHVQVDKSSQVKGFSSAKSSKEMNPFRLSLYKNEATK